MILLISWSSVTWIMLATAFWVLHPGVLVTILLCLGWAVLFILGTWPVTRAVTRKSRE